MPDSPAAELRAAASLLRVRAEVAPEGPWRSVSVLYQDEAFAAVIGAKGSAEDMTTWLVATGRGTVSPDETVDYIAMMSPPVAFLLADWLDDTAAAIEEVPAGCFPVCDPKPALAVARACRGDSR